MSAPSTRQYNYFLPLYLLLLVVFAAYLYIKVSKKIYTMHCTADLQDYYNKNVVVFCVNPYYKSFLSTSRLGKNTIQYNLDFTTTDRSILLQIIVYYYGS